MTKEDLEIKIAGRKRLVKMLTESVEFYQKRLTRREEELKALERELEELG